MFQDAAKSKTLPKTIRIETALYGFRISFLLKSLGWAAETGGRRELPLGRMQNRQARH
jgi:hypothetical protein